MNVMYRASVASLAACILGALASAEPNAAHRRYTPGFESRGLALLDDALAFAQGPQAQAGWAVVTEFMKDPNFVTDTKGEWIEIYNRSPWRVNLEGCVLSDDSGSQHVINTGGAGLRFLPGRYLVLGNNSDTATNGGVHVDYQYSGFSLGNGADQIILSRADGTLVDRVDYDDGVTWPDTAGSSVSVKLDARDAVANDLGSAWCHSSAPISATNVDTGTPGVNNDACP